MERSQDDLTILNTLFKAMIEPFEIDAFACGKAHLADRRLSAFYVIEWPERWRDYYLKSGLIDRDPVIDRLQSARASFTWSEIREDRHISQLGSEALRRAAEHGWTEGLVVPVEIDDPFVGLVSFAARRPAFANEEKAFLTLLSIHFYQRVRDAVRSKGFPVAPAGLTNREIACLRLVAKGCSDRQIGQQLAISTTTAHGHFENAKKKLNASTRAEAIAIAVSLAIVRPVQNA
jgi:DNA-binding CsgD family transcriptional regulator